MLIRILRTFLRPYKRLLAIVVVLQFVQSLASLYLPRLFGEIIDKGVSKGNTSFIWRTGGWMLLISFVQIAFAIGATYIGSRIASGFARDARQTQFERVTAFSNQEVTTLGAASLITRITNDVQQVQLLIYMSCTMMLAAPITAVGGVIMALRTSSEMSWLLAIAIPALAISIGLIVSRMVPEFRRLQERLDNVNKVLREQLTGIRVVRAFVREDHETRRFAAVNRDLTQSSVRSGRLMSAMFPVVLLILNVSIVALVWVGGNRIAAGTLTVGAMLAFMNYLIQVLFAVMMSTFVAVMAPRAAVSAERIQEVLDTEPSIASPQNPVRDVDGFGTLSLENVGFAYPGAEQAVLSGVTLHCAPGQTTAIIGSTGSGKTTLLSLIPRLIDATEGSIVVDGVDIRNMDEHALRERIGLVPQKPYLFSGTVASNLRYGKPEATDEELWEALTVAQAADFVRAMPGGLNEPIVQGGSNVSGGQRQRLSIARALVRKPEIYLFDDTFSALDLITDAKLRAALVPYTREATVLIVAQRISTIQQADQILVLEDGEPVGLGTHRELLATCPTYAEIAASQMTEQDAA